MDNLFNFVKTLTLTHDAGVGLPTINPDDESDLVEPINPDDVGDADCNGKELN